MKTEDSLAKLLDVSSDALIDASPSLTSSEREMAGALAQELIDMLERKNGFFAFEGALHCFSTKPVAGSVSLEEWNSASSWRSEYDDLASGCLFFAEDIFGVQFCIAENKIWSFDPETGERDWLADSLESWAGEVLTNYEILTGYAIAHAWQLKNGAIPSGVRLVPIRPFVLGGAFDLSNMRAEKSIDSMIRRARIAMKIRYLPDGSSVDFESLS